MSPPLGTYSIEPDKQIDLLAIPQEDKSEGSKSPCGGKISRSSSFCSQQSSVDVSGGMSFGFGLGYSANAEQYSLSMIKVTHSFNNEYMENEIVHQAG